MAQADVTPKPATLLFEAHGERIVLDPHRPGKHRARLAEHEVPVWALIAHLQGNAWDIPRTAADYAIPEEAVRAAVDYYRSEPRFIDAFLLLNEDMTTDYGHG